MPRPSLRSPELVEEILARPSIYGLFDQAGALRYIGKANDPENRLMAHMRDARRRDTPVYRWIRKNGLPEMRVLEADCADWREAERRLIAEARVRGERLLNVADGGDEPHCTREQRQANGRKSIAAGGGFTSEQAKHYAAQTNEKMRADPTIMRRREQKSAITRIVSTKGFTPRLLASSWVCAWSRPRDYRRWFERLTGRYLGEQSPEFWDAFLARVDEIADARR